MTVLIVASVNDPAALNIAEKLIDLFGFKESDMIFDGNKVYRNGEVLFSYIKTDSVNANDLDKYFKVDAIIFASRHASKSEEPTFTVHAPGNFNEAEHGGRPKELALAYPKMMRSALIVLKRKRDELALDYSVSLEATHHGPTEMETPVMFIEIGSSEKQWRNDLAGEVVARAIWAATTETKKGKNAIGFGGGHYVPKQTETVLESEVAIGHIMPKYAFESLNEEMVNNMIKRTESKCDLAVLDWKGIKGDERKKLLSILQTYNIEAIRV